MAAMDDSRAKQLFERRLEGCDLSKTERGFYLNPVTWRRWQDFWAGWLAREGTKDPASEILAEVLRGKAYE